MEVSGTLLMQRAARAIDGIPNQFNRLPTPADGRGTLLGLYDGIDLTRRSPLAYGVAMPDKASIFCWPITSPVPTKDRLEPSPRRSYTR